MKASLHTPPHAASHERVEWVDYAKGFCIVMVVAMHSTLGVEARLSGEAHADMAWLMREGETGFMGWLVAFAQPFRMPDFFLVAGLFLARTIGRDWRTYADRKVVHFAYFYVLWVTIQFLFKAPPLVAEAGAGAALAAYLAAFVEPFGTLWFIYMLPVFFVVTKLARDAGVPHWAMLAVGAVLQVAPVHTGALLVDEFASRFVYFYAGYALAPYLFALARRAGDARWLAAGGLAAWAVVNGACVSWGVAGLPVVSLALGAAGALAVVAGGAVLSGLAPMGWLRWLGAHSIVVYLAFFLPMVVAREVLMRLPQHTGIAPTDPAVWALLVTVAGVLGPAVLYGAVRWTGLGRFLFERPRWAKMGERLEAKPA